MIATQSTVATEVDESTVLLEALEKLRQIMIADYNKNKYISVYDIVFEFGSKYIKMVHIGSGSQRSVCGFVVLTKNHKKFAYGDLLKQAGWAGPATNFARGNVFNLDGKKIAWTGIQ